MTAFLLAAESSTRSKFAQFDVPMWVWLAFVGFVAFLLLADLLLVHRKPHEISLKEATIESAVWIAIGLAFTGVMFAWQGGQASTEYLAGYLIEKSLSVDNVFVWAVILTFFRVPPMYRFRVLFWGVFGALVLRAIFIFAGVALVERFEWVLYVFGVFLLYTAVKIARHDEAEVHPEDNIALKIVRRFVPTTNKYDGQKLFTKENGKRVATPLFAVLILVESTDVLFAVDSIPAIIAVSREPFIIFSSNAFAILGLRALYFCLAGMADRFRYLNTGLGVILFYVGMKMILHTSGIWHAPTAVSLGIIIVVLTVAVVASLRAERRQPEPELEVAVGARPEGEPHVEEMVERSEHDEH
ncbi:MAG TPA: TerC family protein [Acidimicrobiia bacterium]|nr:TerC family protein [Acidimicrobiia bacterium]